jgi:predicted house-cleaning noncanonical NTP pyrophosphatase (MazG superfamily)
MDWTRPYFVVSGECFEAHVPRDILNRWVADSISRIGLTLGSPLMIRSSGTAETMRDRGSLASKRTSLEVSDAIDELREKISESARPQVHWIVQEAVDPHQSGHLSNERRVSREPRDWLVEFEASGDYRGYSVPIGIRTWREGNALSSLDLGCSSETEITLRLRQVAKWGFGFSVRIHFEWVWDRQRLWVVQADAEESLGGIDPTSVLPTKIPTVDTGPLQVFRRAEISDYQRYRKLTNADLYQTLGYNMPPFYVTDHPGTIARILGGETTDDLEHDLASLIKRPLMIRTDGANIPDEKREMLPRSDPLASLAEAEDWLLNRFRTEIQRAELQNAELCLIAHHFIPSVASAWARAEPRGRLVRIESLWGIPEGLYWYSHDTFEVDTQEVVLQESKPFDGLQFRVSERYRYKGTFVTADDSGKWTPTRVRPPHDWRPSIKRQEWLFEIAHTTRRLAEATKCPIALMWFVDNHPGATAHRVLPWYHVKSELVSPTRVGPRRKLLSSSDFRITDEASWETLQQRLQLGVRVERVIVDPVDAALIRNPTFARELGRLAAAKNFVIELSGGILSHAYYILTKENAHVECIDLFGVDEERAEYNKIVRDRIPEIIVKRGERAEILRLEGEALVTALRQKLVEESFEALDAKSGDDLVGELADVSEVIAALCSVLKISPAHLKMTQKEKRQKRGGFEGGVMLARTTTPPSIHQPTSNLSKIEPELQLEAPETAVIVDPADLPSRPLYRRPDLRQVDKQPEKLFKFATEANKLGDLRATLHFSLPISPGIEREFSLTLELRRSGSTLRGNIRVLLVPLQLEIQFPDDEA